MIGMNSHTLPNLVPQFRNGTAQTGLGAYSAPCSEARPGSIPPKRPKILRVPKLACRSRRRAPRPLPGRIGTPRSAPRLPRGSAPGARGPRRRPCDRAWAMLRSAPWRGEPGQVGREPLTGKWTSQAVPQSYAIVLGGTGLGKLPLVKLDQRLPRPMPLTQITLVAVRSNFRRTAASFRGSNFPGPAG